MFFKPTRLKILLAVIFAILIYVLAGNFNSGTLSCPKVWDGVTVSFSDDMSNLFSSFNHFWYSLFHPNPCAGHTQLFTVTRFIILVPLIVVFSYILSSIVVHFARKRYT